MISVRQMKSARALLAWSQGDLAAASGVSEPTVARLGSDDGPIGGRAETGEKLVAALRKGRDRIHCRKRGRSRCSFEKAGKQTLQSSEEVQMKVALLSLAVFGTELMTPVSDSVPELNVDALCKARSADDKRMQISEMESVEDCVRDEKTAKQQLSTVWESTSRHICDRCKSEVLFSLGTRSYLDLIS